MLFGLGDVAGLCGRSEATVRRWAIARLIPMEKVGGVWIISRVALAAWFLDLQRLHAAELARWEHLIGG